MHINLDGTIAAAYFTASGFGIEAETVFFVSSCFCIYSLSKQIADKVEHARVGRRIGAGISSDGRLVDEDNLVNILDSRRGVEFAWDTVAAVQLSCKLFVDNVMHKRAFSRS